ncbi:MAG: hypothetical protein ACFCUN_09305 [Hyphomicrobiaceae bacterium]
METTISEELATLERNWIAAEAEADLARHLAEKAEQAADDLRQLAQSSPGEFRLLIGQADAYVRQHKEAEAQAIEAFDRFWTAKNGT